MSGTIAAFNVPIWVYKNCQSEFQIQDLALNFACSLTLCKCVWTWNTSRNVGQISVACGLGWTDVQLQVRGCQSDVNERMWRTESLALHNWYCCLVACFFILWLVWLNVFTLLVRSITRQRQHISPFRFMVRNIGFCCGVTSFFLPYSLLSFSFSVSQLQLVLFSPSAFPSLEQFSSPLDIPRVSDWFV